MLAIIAFVGSLIGSGLVTYYGPYLQNSLARRQELANALADYYSAAASEYYAQADLNRANASNVSKSSNYYIELMKENDLHYRDFLAASSRLAMDVAPDFRDQVLSIEDEWDKINTHVPDATAETEWFKDLDKIRQAVLDRYTSLRVGQ